MKSACCACVNMSIIVMYMCSISKDVYYCKRTCQRCRLCDLYWVDTGVSSACVCTCRWRRGELVHDYNPTCMNYPRGACLANAPSLWPLNCNATVSLLIEVTNWGAMMCFGGEISWPKIAACMTHAQRTNSFHGQSGRMALLAGFCKTSIGVVLRGK